jgi:hypothetical protein
MADEAPPTEPAGPGPAANDTPAWRGWRNLVWAGLSMAFLGYLAFGSVNARFWKYDQLQLEQDFTIEPKSIARIWQVQGEYLPQVTHQWMMQAVFYGAIAVFIACVIVGIRLLLAGAPAEPELADGELR